MNKIVEESLKQVTEDAQKLQAEVTNLEQSLSKKKADLLALFGAVQVLQHVLRRSAAESQVDPK